MLGTQNTPGSCQICSMSNMRGPRMGHGLCCMSTNQRDYRHDMTILFMWKGYCPSQGCNTCNSVFGYTV